MLVEDDGLIDLLNENAEESMKVQVQRCADCVWHGQNLMRYLINEAHEAEGELDNNADMAKLRVYSNMHVPQDANKKRSTGLHDIIQILLLDQEGEDQCKMFCSLNRSRVFKVQLSSLKPGKRSLRSNAMHSRDMK